MSHQRLFRSHRRKPDRWLGLQCALTAGLSPLGARCVRIPVRSQPPRLERGLVILLPGIEGTSTLSAAIVKGLTLGGLDCHYEIVDWRRSRTWSPRHLATLENNRAQAAEIADRILAYRSQFPGRPVHLIGHSAGAGIALFVLEHLPPEPVVDCVVLMAAAVSRRFDVQSLTDRTRRGIWNFWSPVDFPTVGLGTLLFGTVDRRHAFSAGALGFKRSGSSPRFSLRRSLQRVRRRGMAHRARRDAPARRSPSPSRASEAITTSAGEPPMHGEPPLPREPRVHNVGYSLRMLRCWHLGGHFGPTNAAFVRRYVAPILLQETPPDAVETPRGEW